MKWLCLALLVSVASGCTPRYFQADAVTATADGKFWLAGTEGVAGFWDGHSLVERPYPLSDAFESYAYEPFSYPAARVVMDGATAYLFTRPGEVFRWGGQQWDRLNVDFRPFASGNVQVNEVIKTPDGGLLLQLHSDTLLWTTFEGLENNSFEAARTPSYFTAFAFDSQGELFALGWAGDGKTRAIVRRRGGKWHVIVRLPDGFEHAKALAVLQSGTIVVVSAGQAGFVGPQRTEVDVLTVNELAHQGGAEVEPSAASWAAAIVTPDAGPPLVVIHGAATGVVHLSSSDLRFVPCSVSMSSAIGAVRRKEGVLVVDRQGQIWSLGPDGCSAVSPPQIPRTD